MTTIRMDTEAIRDLARQMDLTAIEMRHQAASLEDACGRLAWIWQGGDASNFRHDFRGLLRRFQTQVDKLDELALRLSREVDEWEQADRQRRFEGGSLDILGLGIIGKPIRDLSSIYPWFEKGTQGVGIAYYLAKGLLREGSTYPDQKVFYGPQYLKRLIDLSGNLTHAGAERLPAHLLNNSLSSRFKWLGAGIDFGGKAVDSVARFDSASERAGALVYDMAFVTVKTISSPYLQYGVTTIAVSALSTIGAPVVVVGGGALIAYWASGVVWDIATDKVYDKTIDWGAQKAVVKATQSVAESTNHILNVSVEATRGATSWLSSNAFEAARTVDQVFSITRNALSGVGDQELTIGM